MDAKPGPDQEYARPVKMSPLGPKKTAACLEISDRKQTEVQKSLPIALSAGPGMLVQFGQCYSGSTKRTIINVIQNKILKRYAAIAWLHNLFYDESRQSG